MKILKSDLEMMIQVILDYQEWLVDSDCKEWYEEVNGLYDRICKTLEN